MEDHDADADQDESDASRRHRDALAEDRTVLANERTLAAWWRTGMAGIAAAIAFPRLVSDVSPDWPIRAGSSALALVALVTLVVGHARYRHTARRIAADDVGALKGPILTIATGLLASVALLAGALAWM